jgi:hypothetical protein
MTRGTVFPHAVAAEMARGYADRTVRRTEQQVSRRGTKAPLPRPWIDLDLQRYRSLTGRPRYVGPPPVWVPAEPRHKFVTGR